MQTETVEEVPERLPDMLRQIAPGEEVVILEDGKPVGRLLPAPAPKRVPDPGLGQGKLVIHSDDDEHLKDFEEGIGTRRIGSA